MVENIDEVKEEVKYRLFRSRFFASFSLAFAVANWRAIYVLLFPSNDMGFLDRLAWVDSIVYHTPWMNFIWLLVVPLIYACANVALIPRFINWLEEYRYAAEVEHRNARERIDERLHDKQLEIESIKGELKNEKENNMKLGEQIKQLQEGAKDREVELSLERDKQVAQAKEAIVPFLEHDSSLKRALTSLLRKPSNNLLPPHSSRLSSAGIIEKTKEGWTLTGDGRIIAERLSKK